MLHHYTEFVDEREVAEAEVSCAGVIADYQDIEQHRYPNPESQSKHSSRRTRGGRAPGEEQREELPWNPHMHQLFPAF